MKNGNFARYTYRKRRMLLKRIERLRKQLEQFNLKHGMAASSLAAAALMLAPNEASAQTVLKRDGDEFLVNTTTSSNQRETDISIDAAGNFVAVWRGNGTGDNDGIFAQRYNSDGTKNGSEFLVNDYTTNSQFVPAVAMDDDGDFVVVWAGNGSVDGNGIFAQRFDNTGAKVGAAFRANTYITNQQRNPDIAMDADGDFIITWHSSGQDGSNYGVYAQRYDNAGVAQGSEFPVNTYTTSNQRDPQVAMNATGDFVIAWESQGGQDGDGSGIYAQRYNNAGVAQGSEFLVNTFTTESQSAPSVGIDDDGDFVIAWTGRGQDEAGAGVFAQRFDNTGAAQGDEFQVNTFATGYQFLPDVSMDTDGDFIIAWQSNYQDGSSSSIHAKRYDNAGAVVGGEFLVNTYTTSRQQTAAVALSDDGDYVISWQSYAQDGSGYGVYAQRYRLGDAEAPTDITLSPDTAPDNSRANRAVASLIATDADVDVFTFELVSGDGDTDNDKFTISENQLVPAILLDFEIQETFNIRVQVTDQSGLTFIKALTLTLQDVTETVGGAVGFDEFNINTTTEGCQGVPVIAMDAEGNFVVVWESGSSERREGNDILAQRFDNTGTAVGDEFLVNTYITNSQADPNVAMDADGDFVVVWEGETTGDNSGVIGQRFDNTGTAVGSEFLVNTFTTNTQRNAAVGMDAEGNFVVVWESTNEDGDNQGIYFRRYDNEGVAQEASGTLLNEYTTNRQDNPSVAMDDAGNIVAVWESFGQDGDSDGIYGRMISSAGVLGSEFPVNAFTSEDQRNPSVATDADGDFVVAWDSYHSGDGGIYARRFDSDGTAVDTEEITVKVYDGSGYLSDPRVAMDSDGDFTIVWEQYYYGPGTYETDIITKRYDNTGAVVDDEFSVIENVAAYQFEPEIAMDADGDFVIVWTNYGIGECNDVVGRRFNANKAPTALALDGDNVDEGVDAGTLVGTLSGTDSDFADTQTFNLVSGDGDTGNSAFTISGNQLLTSEVLDFDAQASYAIRVRFTDSGGLFTEANFTVTVNKVLGLEEENAFNSLARLYPNPAQGTLNVTLLDHNYQPQAYQVLDLSGRVIQQGAFGINNTALQVDVEALPDGVYLFQLSGKNAIATTRFVKKR